MLLNDQSRALVGKITELRNLAIKFTVESQWLLLSTSDWLLANSYIISSQIVLSHNTSILLFVQIHPEYSPVLSLLKSLSKDLSMAWHMEMNYISFSGQLCVSFPYSFVATHFFPLPELSAYGHDSHILRYNATSLFLVWYMEYKTIPIKK